MSSSYERMNYITSFGFSIRWRKQFLRSFGKIDEPVEILDLMTGMGENWYAIKLSAPHANLSALDFSEEMLKYAARKNKTAYNNAVTLLQQDVLQNELPSNHYDFVTCAFGLKTLDTAQLQTLAQEVNRILKVGGRFAFVEISKPDNKLLRTLYGFYLSKVIPVLGWLLLGGPDEYKMLWKYTDKFENAKYASHAFANIGLKTEYVSYFYGCASGFYGTKI